MYTIVYCSNSGFTAEYARLLGEKTGLSVFSLEQAKRSVDAGSDVIFLGWLMAGTIQGCRAARKRYAVRSVCAVGMIPGDGQLNEVRRKNNLCGVSLFLLQGGFDLKKLHGFYRRMMKMTIMTAKKELSEKEPRTLEDDNLLELLTNGGNRVSAEALTPVLTWWNDPDIQGK